MANPVCGFGTQINTTSAQMGTEVAPNLEAAKFADEQSLKPEVIQQKPLSHDISHISLHRPQAKLTLDQPGDKYEQEADMMAQVMSMPDFAVQREIVVEEQTQPLGTAITPLRHKLPYVMQQSSTHVTSLQQKLVIQRFGSEEHKSLGDRGRSRWRK
ncbi:ImmA/IrrE family metallo-endopeptidase [Nostoc sp. 'Peltigera membranacea cyanobiont' 232]|uniref:ImmA/IrrE family metallo-endopeptidase n=1 Tax=Nostoc sp. 'Peltigera membranacea cyanobiont' 232 TaxID=2014531 RepID=UPI000B9F3C94|nr:hypothetical protein [Nostoc sp. 'Peltigera membranacea cyanobiont' 232]OYE01411.1 hypothetical protein CDG79_29700 [Nostoc sp. 'Peltigera membranacea cyanobiont' 232]